jgi:hypothetical protein
MIHEQELRITSLPPRESEKMFEHLEETQPDANDSEYELLEQFSGILSKTRNTKESVNEKTTGNNSLVAFFRCFGTNVDRLC